MNKTTSIYLDLIRFSAAMVVFFDHASHERFTDGWLIMFKNFGNDAVMVFFVLSGFVIAYCVDNKEKTFLDYLLSRFARLYSVALPSLCLTVIFDLIGSNLDYKIYGSQDYQMSKLPSVVEALAERVPNIFVVAVLRKTADRDFEVPLQGMYAGQNVVGTDLRDKYRL